MYGHGNRARSCPGVQSARLFRRTGFAGACRSRIVPIGLRGAGKSTIGSRIIISDLCGPNGYRRMEREALESILKQILRGTIIYK